MRSLKPEKDTGPRRRVFINNRHQAGSLKRLLPVLPGVLLMVMTPLLLSGCDNSQFYLELQRIVEEYNSDPIFTVIFESNGGSPVEEQSIPGGGLVTEPTDPTKAGENFVGWYKEASFTTLWNFLNDTVTEDITLYARWTTLFVVTFDIDGDTSAISPQTIADGGLVTEPADPSKTGHTFEGWYETLGVYWVFASDTVTGNMTLHADWTVNSYTVTYQVGTATSGTVPSGPVTYDFGDTVTLLDNTGNLEKIPDPPGSAYAFAFGGWNTSITGFGTTYQPGDDFTLGAGNVYLYPYWVPFEIGDPGPGDGVVFYDKGAYSDGWRYLEVTNSDVNTHAIWDPDNTDADVLIGTGTAIGTGKTNTDLIIAEYGTSAGMYSALAASQHNGGGYNDWFLPSRDEWNEIYDQRAYITGLGETYHSSSETSATNAYFKNSGTGAWYNETKEYYYRWVRAVRRF